MAAVNALRLANQIVRWYVAQGKTTPTNLEFQKLAYFCHGWHLALIGTPLVDEEFEAWRFGPVLPSVYHKFKVFSSNPIPADHPLVAWESPLEPNSASAQLVDRVLQVYGGYPGFELVRLSHDVNGPWAKVWTAGAFSSESIDNESIKEYFTALARNTPQ